VITEQIGNYLERIQIFINFKSYYSSIAESAEHQNMRNNGAIISKKT